MFVLITTGIFLYFSHFNDSVVYKKYYYLWIKVMDFVLIAGYIFFTKKYLKRAFFVISAFFLMRVIWQLFEIENYYSANKPKVIDFLFVLCVLSVLVISMMPLLISFFKTIYAKRLKNGGD